MGVGVDTGSTVEEFGRAEEAAGRDGHVLMEWPIWNREGERSGRRIRARRHDGFRGEWRTVLEVRTRGDHWTERTTLGYADDLGEIELHEP